MHERSEIRKKAAEMLSGKTNAGTRVFPSRKLPPDEEELPLILVFTGTETVTEFDTDLDKRELDLMVEYVDKDDSAESMDDKLDTGANQIEDVFQQERQLEDLVDDIQLESSEPGVDESDPDIQAIVLKYKVTYYTSRATTSGLTPFRTIGVAIGDDSTDEIVLPQ